MCTEPLSTLLCYAVRFLPGALVLICTELPASNQGPSLVLANTHLLQAAPQATAGGAWLSLAHNLCGLLLTRNFHVDILSPPPQKKELWADPTVPSVQLPDALVEAQRSRQWVSG